MNVEKQEIVLGYRIVRLDDKALYLELYRLPLIEDVEKTNENLGFLIGRLRNPNQELGVEALEALAKTILKRVDYETLKYAGINLDEDNICIRAI